MMLMNTLKAETMDNQEVLKVGDKVHYVPYDGADVSKYENGIVKDLGDFGNCVFVVYHCAGEWDNYQSYTAALTQKRCLRKGWSMNSTEALSNKI